MSKTPLDSDLYGDIYGDDDETESTTQPGAEGELEDFPEEQPTETIPSPSHEQNTEPKKSQIVTQDALRSLPPKPMSPNSLSYSAQIAQQFSAYQQTPSQERQQRAEIPLPPNPRSSAGAPPATTAPREDTSSTAADSVFGKKPSEMHDSGKLFIGGLNWDTTDEGLRNYFSQFGKVDACTIMRDPSGTSRGFAFLTFEDAIAVNAVVAREHTLDGKPIDPKRAIPREEHLRNTRYFVGGLAPTSTSDTMREFFAAYGKVVDATVMVDRESGRSKGFGFVTFEDASNADQLVGKIGLILDDKQIEVKMAQPRSQRDQARAATTPTSSRESSFSDQASRTMPTNMSFTQQPNQMSMMFQRPMGQVPMMGGNMPMMNMNPMAMAMGMGMGGFNPMGGMNGMNMMNGMGGMNGMNAMNGMGNMGAMRLGMGPMGVSGMGPTGMGATGMGAAGMAGAGMAGAGNMGGMNAMAMGMRPNMVGMGAVNPTFGRMAMNTAAAAGPGPARITSRGQHNFHPYSR